jgi:hypothetical protein
MISPTICDGRNDVTSCFEARRQRVAVAGVSRRVHRQQHVAHHGQLIGREVFEHDPAFARGIEVGLAGNVDHVGVLEHRPIARLTRHVLPENGPSGPQVVEHVVGHAGDVAIGVVDVEIVGTASQVSRHFARSLRPVQNIDSGVRDEIIETIRPSTTGVAIRRSQPHTLFGTADPT